MLKAQSICAKGGGMKKILIGIFVLVATAAFAANNFSVSGSIGYASATNNGLVAGIEATWDCRLYQPEKGRLRPTIDVEFGGGGFQAAALMRYLVPVGKTGLGLGGGVGLRYDQGVQAYFRGDLMYRLDRYLGAPVVLGADVGYAYGFGAAPQELVAHIKAGYCFEF